jgi:hypothetical protein
MTTSEIILGFILQHATLEIILDPHFNLTVDRHCTPENKEYFVLTTFYLRNNIGARHETSKSPRLAALSTETEWPSYLPCNECSLHSRLVIV